MSFPSRDHTHSHSRRRAAGIALFLLLAHPQIAPATVESAPETGPPVDRSTEEVESIHAPSETNATDAGAFDLEHAKLELARAAIEASRAAGTLWVTPRLAPPLVVTPEEAAALKLQRLEEARSAAILPSELTGFGVETPPLQETGPPGLTDAEAMKLETLEGITPQGGRSNE